MKRIKKIGLTVFAGLLVFSSLCYLLVSFEIEPVIKKQLQNITNRQVSLDYCGLSFPWTLVIKRLEINGLAKVDYVSVTPSLSALLTGNIGFNGIKLVRPELTYERFSTPPVISAVDVPGEGIVQHVPQSVPAAPVKKTIAKAKNWRVILKQLKITGGKLNIIDHTVGPEGINLAIKDIDFDVTNLYLTKHPAVANFKLEGSIPWEEGREEGKVHADGWIDLFNKNMGAVLNINNIDGIRLYPYYSNWVDLEKSRISRARLDFNSQIHGLHNDVTANCHLELSDIEFRERSGEEAEEKAERIAHAVLDIFKSLNEGKIILNFSVKTKMDKPQFGFGDIRGAFEDKLTSSRKSEFGEVGSVVMLPANLIKGVIKGTADISKAVIDGTFSVGNEIKKSVEDSFRKTPPEPQKEEEKT